MDIGPHRMGQREKDYMDQDIRKGIGTPMGYWSNDWRCNMSLYTPQWGCWWQVADGRLLMSPADAISGQPDCDEWGWPEYITKSQAALLKGVFDIEGVEVIEDKEV